LYSIRRYDRRQGRFSIAGGHSTRGDATTACGNGGKSMARSLSIIGFLALAIGLLWIGQGTGAIRWPPSSVMVNQLQWAGYGALLGGIGLILIWQGNR
jgi:hypothetical protein